MVTLESQSHPELLHVRSPSPSATMSLSLQVFFSLVLTIVRCYGHVAPLCGNQTACQSLCLAFYMTMVAIISGLFAIIQALFLIPLK